jgi:hypothetical protein
MIQSSPRFKILLATLLPLMFLWVPVACLSICMDGCRDEEEVGTITSSDEPRKIDIKASSDDCHCPIPQSPECALQKSYAYEAPANGDAQTVNLNNVFFNPGITSHIANSTASTIILKPPLKRLCALRI